MRTGERHSAGELVPPPCGMQREKADKGRTERTEGREDDPAG
jgi:hypothetical protein